MSEARSRSAVLFTSSVRSASSASGSARSPARNAARSINARSTAATPPASPDDREGGAVGERGRMDILVSELGPRDGLQSVKRAMPTAVKHKWIRALAAAGLKEIEVASFVPPKLLPQMADAAEVVREAIKIPGITVLALVPNLRGFQDAAAAGAPKVTLTVSASEAHSMSNIRMTCAEALESVA